MTREHFMGILALLGYKYARTYCTIQVFHKPSSKIDIHILPKAKNASMFMVKQLKFKHNANFEDIVKMVLK